MGSPCVEALVASSVSLLHPQDWSFWGLCLGVEGRSIGPFLVMLLGMSHSSVEPVRCKLILEQEPRVILHENVMPFPERLLDDVLGSVALLSFHMR